ncbi:cysteine hydrolase family protein [Alsobacter sp. R-9]
MRIPSDTALLVVDVQGAIDDPRWGRRNNPGAEAAIAALIGAWRDGGFPVVHVRHDSVEPASPYRPGQPLHAFKPEAMPREGEAVVGKATGSAFVGTGLEEHLDGLGCTTLVVCGVLAHNSVDTTARHAGCLGYRVFVVSDACWSVETRDPAGRTWPAEDVHALAMAHLSGEYARVVTAAEAVAAARLTATVRGWRRQRRAARS